MARKTFGRFMSWLFSLTVLLLFLSGIYHFAKRGTSQAPSIKVTKLPKAIGNRSEIGFSIEDKIGLRDLSVTLEQGGVTASIFSEKYEGPKYYQLWKRGLVKRKDVKIELNANALELKEGTARLSIAAHDYSLRRLVGNKAVYQTSLMVALLPPRLEAISKQHYINYGASELVIYRVSKNVETSGVKVGDYFFPGFPGSPDDPEIRFAFFAVPYDLPANSNIKLVATDAAGNEAEARFFYKVFPRKFPESKIRLSDDFLQTKMPEFLSSNPSLSRDSDLVRVFHEVNGPLRNETKKQIQELTKKSQPRMLWSKVFHQLRNSKVESNFAQQRTYVYDGRVIDHSMHLGYDLAVTRQAPIEAANDGIVIFSGDLGIFGQTVVLDHGMGLLTLYGHMSSRRVRIGDHIKRGDILGQTGNTGLAMGDHLHFTVLLNGVEVDCKEWWDPHWIKVHVEDKIKALSDKIKA